MIYTPPLHRNLRFLCFRKDLAAVFYAEYIRITIQRSNFGVSISGKRFIHDRWGVLIFNGDTIYVS